MSNRAGPRVTQLIITELFGLPVTFEHRFDPSGKQTVSCNFSPKLGSEIPQNAPADRPKKRAFPEWGLMRLLIVFGPSSSVWLTRSVAIPRQGFLIIALRLLYALKSSKLWKVSPGYLRSPA